MKKSVYDLKVKELVKLRDEVAKTEYYRLFFLQYLASIIIVLVVGILSSLCFCLDDCFGDVNMLIPFYILFGVVMIITARFFFKRVELIKEYYELKNEKKD